MCNKPHISFCQCYLKGLETKKQLRALQAKYPIMITRKIDKDFNILLLLDEAIWRLSFSKPHSCLKYNQFCSKINKYYNHTLAKCQIFCNFKVTGQLSLQNKLSRKDAFGNISLQNKELLTKDHSSDFWFARKCLNV